MCSKLVSVWDNYIKHDRGDQFTVKVPKKAEFLLKSSELTVICLSHEEQCMGVKILQVFIQWTLSIFSKETINLRDPKAGLRIIMLLASFMK